MNTPGNVLKAEREKQNKSISEISRELKINTEYIKAIESENYQLLPAEVFIKAYLRLYAGTLHLEGDDIVRLYEDQIKTHDSPEEPKPAGENIILHHKQVFIIGAVVLFAVLWIIFAGDKKKEPEKKSVMGAKIAEINAGQKPVMKAPNEKRKTEKQTLQLNEKGVTREVREERIVKEPPGGKMSLTITATELTWVSVRIDGSSRKEWLMRAGDKVTLEALNGFAVKVGNAGGTRLSLNNKDIGELGPHGKTVDIILPEKGNS